MSADDRAMNLPKVHEYPDDPRAQDWIARVRTGDTAAFEELCRVYRPRLLGTARRAEPSDPEDLVQEVLIRTWQYREKMDTPGLFFTILRNLLIDRARAEERRARYAEQLSNDLAFELDLVTRIDGKRRARCLAEAYATLPKEDRVIVTTKGNGMTFDDMAVLFKKPETTIRRHFNRIVDVISGLVQRCLERGSR